MGLFDFLFGSDESSTKQWGPRKFLIFGESGGTSRPMPQSGSHCDLVAEREERHTGIEPASSAWEADALPMC